MTMAGALQDRPVFEEWDGPRIIEMKRGIPGFERIQRYVLKPREQEPPFGMLESLEEGGPCFVVVNPFLACPGYEPVISEREARLIELDDPSRASLLVFVTIRRDPPDVTVNLQAPLVINTDTSAAVQTVLENQEWPLRYSIMA